MWQLHINRWPNLWDYEELLWMSQTMTFLLISFFDPEHANSTPQAMQTGTTTSSTGSPQGCVLSPLLYLLITNAWPPTAPTPTFSLLMAQLLLWSTDKDRHLFIVRLKLTFVRPHGLLFWSVQPRTATTTIKVTFPFSCSCFSLGFLWTCSCWAAVSLTCIADLKCRHTELFLMAAT